jgi:hypothetical protein
VAVLVIGWLGVLYRDHRILDDVSPGLIGDSRMSDREFEREARRLERADLLNPDPTWRLNLGLAMVDRNPRRAVREFQGVVTSEPDNLIAWKILRVGARPVDRRSRPGRRPRSSASIR